MTANNGYNTMHACVDQSPESIPGFDVDINNLEWVSIKSDCNSLPCPPYSIAEKSLSCVVCSR